MKRIVFIASLTILLVAGCTKEVTQEKAAGTILTAVLDDWDASTRTAIETPTLGVAGSEDGLTVKWLDGDQIALYDNGSTYPFTCGASGRKIPVSSDATLSGSGTYYGFYPNSGLNGFSEADGYSSMIPINQRITGTLNWDPSAPLMTGSCAAGSRQILFTNAHALAEIYLPAAADNVTINAEPNHPLSGNVLIASDGSSVQGSGEDKNYVSLSGSLSAEKPYYLSLIPGTTSEIVILVNYTGTGGNIDAEGAYLYSHESPVTFSLNRISVMDFRNVSPINLGNPVSDFKPMGTYMFVGPDGSCIMIKGKNGNDFKFSDIQFSVYWTDTGADDLLITGVSAETHAVNVDISEGLRSVVITVVNPIDSNGQAYSGSYYLAYSQYHNGAFYCVTDRALATRFTGYKID